MSAHPRPSLRTRPQIPTATVHPNRERNLHSNPNERAAKRSSLDLTQKLEKKLAALNASDNIIRRWLWELTSWTISALSIGAIVGILFYLDHKSLTTWPLGLTINNVLSKIASAALILPVSEALGQLKWLWFQGRKSKEIWDFEIFDKASRGAWGSVMLLLRTRGRSLAALGAILTVLLIANDTFFQQVVDLPERWSLESNSTIAKSVQYSPDRLIEFKGGLEVATTDRYLRPVQQEFFYDNGTHPSLYGNGTRPEIPVSCPTSNCTFPAYETLGVCSQCSEVSSDLLQFGCRVARVDWIANLTRDPDDIDHVNYPNATVCGYFFNITVDFPTLRSGYSTTAMMSPAGQGLAGEALLLRTLPLITNPDREALWGGSINFKHLRNPLTDVIIVAAKDGINSVYRNETPMALECALSWCIKSVQSTFAFGRYREDITKVQSNSTPGQNPWVTSRTINLAGNATTMTYTENVTIVSSSDGRSYGLDNITQLTACNSFDEIFPAFLTAPNDTSEPSFRYKTSITGFPYFRKSKWNPWLPPNNVTHHMERLSTAMTNIVRSSTGTEHVIGSAYNMETYVKVRWAWLTFPLVLLILSLLFLVATMTKTSKGADIGMRAWKTSAMPTLIYGLPGPMQKQFTSSSSWKYDGSIKGTRVRIQPQNGWRVSGDAWCGPGPVVVERDSANVPFNR